MTVYLFLFNDSKELLGICSFTSFCDLIKLTDNFFSYNDVKKIAKKKEKFFRLVLI